MTGGETLVLTAFYGVPSVAAVVLSFFAKSRVARTILSVAGAVSLMMIAAIVVAEWDCDRADFTFYGCATLGAAVADAIGIAQVFFVIGYVTLGPVLLIVAGLAEWLAWRGS